jgi:repressor LexA
LNGEATIKTYFRKAGVIELHPANKTMQSLIVKQADAFQIEGLGRGDSPYAAIGGPTDSLCTQEVVETPNSLKHE